MLVLAAATAASSQVQPPDLHAALHIRPDQEAAFSAYQAAIAPPQREIAQLRANSARLRSVSTPERLDLASQNMAIQANLFARAAAATKRFYATLSGQQQRIFDAISLPPQGGPPSR